MFSGMSSFQALLTWFLVVLLSLGYAYQEARADLRCRFLFDVHTVEQPEEYVDASDILQNVLPRETIYSALDYFRANELDNGEGMDLLFALDRYYRNGYDTDMSVWDRQIINQALATSLVDSSDGGADKINYVILVQKLIHLARYQDPRVGEFLYYAGKQLSQDYIRTQIRKVGVANYYISAAQPPGNVPGEYWDLNSGLEALRFMHNLPKDRQVRIFVRSQFAAGMIHDYAEEHNIKNIITDSRNAWDIEKLDQPVAMFRVQYSPSKTRRFEERAKLILDWLRASTEGGTPAGSVALVAKLEYTEGPGEAFEQMVVSSNKLLQEAMTWGWSWKSDFQPAARLNTLLIQSLPLTGMDRHMRPRHLAATEVQAMLFQYSVTYGGVPENMFKPDTSLDGKDVP